VADKKEGRNGKVKKEDINDVVIATIKGAVGIIPFAGPLFLNILGWRKKGLRINGLKNGWV
jgi:hypothetical protein